MPWKLIGLIIALALFLFFAGYNTQPVTINIGPLPIENVPLFVALFIAFILGIASALSTGAVSFLGALPGIGLSFLDFFNALFGNYSLSLGALLISIFVGYKWGVAALAKEVEIENNIFYFKRVYTFLIRFISPIGIALVLGYILITGKYF